MIEQLDGPEILKKLSVKQMNMLAAEIRSFLIDSVSKTGGHLSSNLGVVELTIALHAVFDSPKDKLIFDVGHQSYVHKILTGRSGRFDTMRQWEGLCGFQKMSESEHDVWEAGHAGTSLSAALGYATARDLNAENHQVVCIIGDGSMNNGMVYEALNQIGDEQRNLVIILNDNAMSISQNVGALTKSLAKLRTSNSYNHIKHDVKEILKSNSVGTSVLGGLQKVKDTLKKSIVDSSIFGELGIEYLGPVDGHDFKQLIRILNTAKKHEGPVLVHVLTVKGKGYPHSENDLNGTWHGVNQFDPDTGTNINQLPAGHLPWSQVVSETLIRLSKKDEKILAITPAMMQGSKLEKYFALFPTRSFDCGIAEEHAATYAAGLALAGYKPFLSIYSTFLQRSYDQINHDIARMDLPVVLGIDRSGLVGEDGATHHGVFDVGILRPIPNLILSQPKDATEAQHLLYTAFNQKHPFGIRYPRGNAFFQEVGTYQEIETGTWTSSKALNQADLIVIAYGPDVDKIVQKAEINQLNIATVNARFFKPLDHRMLQAIASLKKPVIVYETDMLAGGLSSAILEWICDNNISMDLHRIGLEDKFVEHGSVPQLRKDSKIDITTLFNRIVSILGNHAD
ncbi:MAG: 1-deoxy-D-xylulose-5-phosphate synthase [Firmicutes bacterium GWE2_51_13]|nr:MAG: 1-deoxy-D-xylulose-5-phosphate synthase [Firmicutes bacterium GWE2_51_13]